MKSNDSFEWDERKNAINRQKHGLAFDDAVRVFADPRARSWRSHAGNDPVRWVTIGRVDGILIAVVHTRRGAVTRLISARRARDTEAILYGRP